METEAIIWSEFPNGESTIVEQLLVSEERKKSKRVGPRETHSEIWVEKLTLCKVIWDNISIYNIV